MIGLFAKIKLLWRIFIHEEAPWSVKLLLLGTFFYIIFPLDLFPDHILLAGWLDDLALAVVMYILALKITPEALVKKILNEFKHVKKQDDPK
ncbi:MAG: DUF1232 domain-containing protein [Proteobacteria bacterium]|nr:DUF1232 domain-containing protein [Pseudomonadota bacterium]MBU1639212.1 DUF1232 domain-containing protein [Pseudomonadota bacterium]